MLPVSRIAARYLPERLYARTMHLSLAVLAWTYCHRVFVLNSVFVNASLTVFLMVFLCCQALAQDAGAHGRRARQALNFGRPLSLLPELFRCFVAFSILQTHLHVVYFSAGSNIFIP